MLSDVVPFDCFRVTHLGDGYMSRSNSCVSEVSGAMCDSELLVGGSHDKDVNGESMGTVYEVVVT